MRLIVLSCAWVLGIFTGSRFQLPAALVFCGLLPVPAVFIWPKFRQRLVLLSLSLVLFFGAAGYFAFRSSAEPPLTAFNGRGTVEICGMVETPPEPKNSLSSIELAAREITVDGKTVETAGTLLVFLPLYPEYRYGDVLRLKGKLAEPPEFQDFDYQAYLAGKGIFSLMTFPSVEVISHEEGNRPLAWIYSLRLKLAHSLSAALPEPQAGLAQGILLGIRSSLPDTLKNNLAVTGTSHLLAISGMNLTIIAGVLITVGLWLFGRRHYIYVWLALFMIWFYALLTGMQAPVVRSVIMASIFLLAELLGRQKNILTPLIFSAAIMVAVTPLVLWDVSFQLSFLAMIGLVFLAPPLQTAAKTGITRIMGEDNTVSSLAGVVSDSLCVSLGSIIAVWPVIACNFGIISIIGPFSTLLIAPALSPIIFSTALTALLGLISPPAAQVAGWIAWVFLSYMLWLVNAFAGLALVSFNSVRINGAVVWIYYILLGLGIWFGSYLKKLAVWFKSGLNFLKSVPARGFDGLKAMPVKFIIIPLLLIALITSLAAATLPDGDLHVTILDVGEGDAVLIRSGRQNILIDGGPNPQPVLLGLGDALPFWDRKLDLVVLTHPHIDHLGGLIEVLRNYDVEKVLTTGLISSTPYFTEWNDLLKEKAVSSFIAASGQCLDLNYETKLEVLNPSGISAGSTEEDIENDGIMLRLTRGKVSFLFTADIGPETEEELIRNRADLACTVLKVSHHGSASSSTAAFLSVARPKAAVISVGAENRFGHPSPQVLERLKDLPMAEANIYRTDLSGTIEFTTDGTGLWVKTER
jgi:competence protein ComEC